MLGVADLLVAGDGVSRLSSQGDLRRQKAEDLELLVFFLRHLLHQYNDNLQTLRRQYSLLGVRVGESTHLGPDLVPLDCEVEPSSPIQSDLPVIGSDPSLAKGIRARATRIRALGV